MERISLDCYSSLGFYNLTIKFYQTRLFKEAAEHYLVDMFEGANLCALHTGRVTLMQKDVKLLRQLRGEVNEIFNF